jgi:hypothetical protein
MTYDSLLVVEKKWNEKNVKSTLSTICRTVYVHIRVIALKQSRVHRLSFHRVPL